MSPRYHWSLPVAAFAMLGLDGCIARMTDQRSYEPPRPAADASPELVSESRPAGVRVTATARPGAIDVSAVQATECRRVTVVPMVRDVRVSRSFVPGSTAQEWNAVTTMLLLTGAGLIAFDGDTLACPQKTAGCVHKEAGPSQTMVSVTAGLAAIPLLLFGYNALRVRDREFAEQVAPATEAGAWQTCETRPLAGETVAVLVGDRTLQATTGTDGHVSVDVLAAGLASAPRAVVRHEGSPDVVVDLMKEE